MAQCYGKKYTCIIYTQCLYNIIINRTFFYIFFQTRKKKVYFSLDCFVSFSFCRFVFVVLFIFRFCRFVLFICRLFVYIFWNMKFHSIRSQSRCQTLTKLLIAQVSGLQNCFKDIPSDVMIFMDTLYYINKFINQTFLRKQYYFIRIILSCMFGQNPFWH